MKVGDEVSVDFIGEITRIERSEINGKIYYTIKTPNSAGSNNYAIVEKNVLTPAEGDEENGKNNL